MRRGGGLCAAVALALLALGAGSGAAASPSASWVPPVNPTPAASPLVQDLLYAVVLVMRCRFPVLFGGLFAAMLVPKLPLWLRIALGVAALANFLGGAAWSDGLLYRAGEASAATITGSYATSTQYNDHDVVGYNVLIRRRDGTVVAARFADDDFNVYPFRNATSYPGVGDVFTVRHLARHPDTFAIVADDASPWATALRCRAAEARSAEAAARAAFARGGPASGSNGARPAGCR